MQGMAPGANPNPQQPDLHKIFLGEVENLKLTQWIGLDDVEDALIAKYSSGSNREGTKSQ